MKAYSLRRPDGLRWQAGLSLAVLVLGIMLFVASRATAANCSLGTEVPYMAAGNVQGHSYGLCPTNPGSHVLRSHLIWVKGGWLPDDNIATRSDTTPNSYGDYHATATGCVSGGTNTYKTVGDLTGDGQATSGTKNFSC